jgi:hypothetical protein
MIFYSYIFVRARVGTPTATGEEGEGGAHGAQMGKDKYAEAK